MKRFFALIIVLVVLSGCSYNNIQNKPTLSAQNNDKEALAPTTVLSYSDVVDKKSIISKKISEYETEDATIYKGQEVKWQGKISQRYIQRDGIKFCILDDKHINPDVNADCDWFWAIPKELATDDDPSLKPDWDGYWNKFVFKEYSDIDYNKIDYKNDVFLITGIIDDIDTGVDYNERPIPDIEIIRIEKVNSI